MNDVSVRSEMNERNVNRSIIDHDGLGERVVNAQSIRIVDDDRRDRRGNDAFFSGAISVTAIVLYAYTHLAAFAHLVASATFLATLDTSQTCPPENTYTYAVLIAIYSSLFLLRLACYGIFRRARTAQKFANKWLFRFIGCMTGVMLINAPAGGLFSPDYTTCSRKSLTVLLQYVQMFYVNLTITIFVYGFLFLLAICCSVLCDFDFRADDDGVPNRRPSAAVGQETIQALTQLVPISQVVSNNNRRDENINNNRRDDVGNDRNGSNNDDNVGCARNNNKRVDTDTSGRNNNTNNEDDDEKGVDDDNDIDADDEDNDDDDARETFNENNRNSRVLEQNIEKDSADGAEEKEQEESSSSSGEKCAICLSSFKTEQEQSGKEPIVRMLRCGHYFHDYCISPYLLHYVGECPMCKQPLQCAQNLRSSAHVERVSPPSPSSPSLLSSPSSNPATQLTSENSRQMFFSARVDDEQANRCTDAHRFAAVSALASSAVSSGTALTTAVSSRSSSAILSAASSAPTLTISSESTVVSCRRRTKHRRRRTKIN